MKTKILKFLKWFLAIVLIVISVVVTVLLFFKYHKQKQVQQVDLSNALTSLDKKNFDKNFENVIDILSDDGQGDWFADLKTTSNKLDNSLDVLINYYIDSNFVVSDNNVADTYSTMINTRNLLNSMFSEYIVKSESEYFPKITGANDIYSVYSTYLVRYAKFVQAIDKNVNTKTGFNCISDIKFSIIDLQTRIVASDFSKLTTVNNQVKIASSSNVKSINSYVLYQSSYIIAQNGITATAIQFINSYENCNKTYFAEHFVEVLNDASSIGENSSNEQKCAYYFKKLF